MGMFDTLIPAISVQSEINEEKSELNFQNEDSIEQRSPYNTVRFSRQNTAHKDAQNVVAVAEKAKNNLNKKIEEQKHEEIQIGDLTVDIRI